MKAVKLLIGAAVLGSVTFTSAALTCRDDKGLTFLPAQEVVIREMEGSAVVKVGKICFKEEADYQAEKTALIDAYKIKTPEERFEFLKNEGGRLDDFVTHEIEKLGTIDIENFTEKDDVLLRAIETLESL